MNIKQTFFVLFIILAQALAACASVMAQATPTSTVVPTPTADPKSSAKIVQAFWDAMQAGDLDTAMSYVADDIICRGFCYFSGKETFQTYMQGYLGAGFLTTISEVKAVGSIVTYSWEVYRDGNFLQGGDHDEMMEIEDGKIVYWENHHR